MEGRYLKKKVDRKKFIEFTYPWYVCTHEVGVLLMRKQIQVDELIAKH